MEPSYIIENITLEECLPLRRDVLWPLLHTQDCIEAGDEDATHYGYCVDNKIISCLSVFFRTPERYQIRKFATHAYYQNKGIGSILFTHVLKTLKQQQVQTVYLNARFTAVRFYEKFNFKRFDQEFTKNNVLFVPMEFDLRALSL
ncbi:GNAT family N-acetyltransferase [Commensalibacter oyaizuii]|uniref:GNAT family N-acetyltransferase n=1 Tax=Commensalibacter oyaizuii TaxID=3043873 RepID=A0ABT6PZP5_9PROT|nr:GNAT family N-acetyltransferase [Commensalibacter sp. TBRC 16381]MDI2089981.1 GNAT family N-acetyltransferase [Commensalibacter sp. TBRC 16381]